MAQFLNEYDILKKKFTLRSDDDFVIDTDTKKFINNILRRNVLDKIPDTKKISDFLQLSLDNGIIPKQLLGFFYHGIGVLTLIGSDFRAEFKGILDEEDERRLSGLESYINEYLKKGKLIGIFGEPINNTEELEEVVQNIVYFRNHNIDDIIAFMEDGESVDKGRISKLSTSDFFKFDFIKPDREIFADGELYSSQETEDIYKKFEKLTTEIERKEFTLKLYGLLGDIPDEPDEPDEPEEPEEPDKPYKQGFTEDMIDDDEQLTEYTEVLDKNAYLKSQLLQNNENRVLSEKPLEYLTQAQDIARANRRKIESDRYFNDEFERSIKISDMYNRQQYLTMQTRSNMLYGIPSEPGINSDDIFFTI